MTKKSYSNSIRVNTGSMSKIQDSSRTSKGLSTPTVFKDLKLMKNTDLCVIKFYFRNARRR